MYSTLQCNYPVWLNDYDLYVPCGRCRACRIARAREWSVRLLHELGYHDKSVFLTLTYSDGDLPLSGEIDKAELQGFIKRLRRRLEPDRIKYFAAGEYGEKSDRPHYHAIMFNVGYKDYNEIKESWNKGFVYVGSVTYDSCRYVADYIQKRLIGGEAIGKREQPFALMSKGIGLRFAKDNESYLKSNLGCTVRGVRMGLPKYYQKKLEIDGSDLFYASEDRRSEVLKHYDDKYDGEGVFKAVRAHHMQSERNLRAKASIRSKGKI